MAVIHPIVINRSQTDGFSMLTKVTPFSTFAFDDIYVAYGEIREQEDRRAGTLSDSITSA
jgi:hypothetical protein